MKLETIIDAAVVLIEREGLEKLTMRNLAAEVGCGTMSLYSYVQNRDDLINSIAKFLVNRSGILAIAHRSHARWQDLVFETHQAYKNLAVRYPRSFEILALAPYNSVYISDYLDDLAHSFIASGLSTDQAYEVLGSLDAYSTGFLTVWTRTQQIAHQVEEHTQFKLTQLRSLDTFERGIRVFIAGYEAHFGTHNVPTREDLN